ncbi:LCP family protein [Mycobacterium montefiorense]|uniref:LCP family protein n=3 Tax=Mycobacterium montefiorense TaxID=154654 RepID=UPI0021F279AF|nr:LCP family protein [Mycobacterium montefiorense]MCV7427238.1 LCP family protein [Mycobacterium montefiorense]
MSDGEVDATFGHRRSPDRQPVTPTPPVARSAAPWERFSESPADGSIHRWQIEPRHQTHPETPAELFAEAVEPPPRSSASSGNHSSGAVSVADLIAKVGTGATGTRHRRAALDDEPAEPDPEWFVDQQDTQVIDTPAYSLDVVSEIPDLELTNYPNGDDSESELPAEEASTSHPVKPEQARRPKSPASLAPKLKSRRRPILLALRSLTALFAGLALALTGGAWQWSASKNHRLNIVNALDPNSGDIVDPSGQYGDEDFLIVGMDSRSGANADMGAGDTEDAGGARSDTVMLVNIPANRKRVVAVSFPRDLAITPMQCEAWNPDTGKYGPLYDEKTKTWGSKNIYTETKLNSAFSFGGPKCLVKEIQKLSGLSINRFIAVDFSGFAKMVEALGGVEVCSKTPLHDYELGTVLEHSGRQLIDGPTALNYVRARQVTTEFNGDYGRIKRQQLFLSSLLRSLISEDTLTDLNKLNNVVNMFISNSRVDNVGTKDLVQLGQSLQGMAAGHFTFVTVPTGVTDQNGDEPPRTSDMKALFNAIINDDPLPEENDQNAASLGTTPTSGPTTAPTTKKAPPPSTTPEARREQVTTTSPDEVTVRVSNATAQSGLAATATTALKRNGFNVMSPDDYPSSLTSTTVFVSPGNEQAAATVASAFANSKVARVSGYGQVVQVVLGPDFKAVTAPAPSGSSLSVQIDRSPGSTPTKLPDDLTVTNAADTTCE